MKILTENYLKSLEKEILTENYSDLFDKVYSDFRKEQSEFKTEIIEIGKIYYRARVGNDTMEVNHEDPKAFITVYNVSHMQYQPKVWK